MKLNLRTVIKNILFKNTFVAGKLVQVKYC